MMRFFVFVSTFIFVNLTFAQTQSKYNDEEILNDSKIIQVYDSISHSKFFYSQFFNSDKSLKIDYSANKDELVDVSDSLLQIRIAEMNATSPFEYVYTPEVRSHIRFYLSKKAFLSRILGLTELYFPLFEEVLDKYNLPLELKFVSIIESALNPIARSRAGASGLWQFMQGTAKLYDLEINSYIDDRFDPYKSTEAACRHFIDLYDIYGDWALCLAAYNAGVGRVNRTIAKANNEFNFWKIQHLLPKETQRYVPYFIAASYVFTYYKEHNIVPTIPSAFYAEIDTVHVRAELSFDVVAELLDIPIDVVTFFNPTYKRELIPAPVNRVNILRLPKNKLLQFDEKELEMYFLTYGKKYPLLLKNYTIVEEYTNTTQITDIISDDTLSDTLQIIDINIDEDLAISSENIDSNAVEIEATDSTLIVDKPKKEFIQSIESLLVIVNSSEIHQIKNSKSTVSVSNSAADFHTVKRGESLGSIARTYKCSVNDLMRWNNLKSQTIHPNQKLIISSTTSTNKTVQTTTQTTVDLKNNPIIHTVKSGDSLWSISNKYGVSVDKIKQDNSLKDNSIQIGQKIKIQS